VALTVGDNEYIDASGRPTTLEREGQQYFSLLKYYTVQRNDFVVERDFGSYASLIQGNYVPNGWLLRRSSVADVGGYAINLTLDDWSLLLRLAKKYRLRFTGSVLAKYRVHEKNTIAVDEGKLFLDTARVLLQERVYCRQHGLELEWSRHAHRVFEKLTREQIERIVEDPAADENWWDDKLSRIEDLARIGKGETDSRRLQSDLDHVTQKWRASFAEQTRLQTEHEADQSRLRDAAERLSLIEQAHRNELESLTLTLSATSAQLSKKSAELSDLEKVAERLRIGEIAYQAEREQLTQALSSQYARLSELEASRTWRWTEWLRRGCMILAHLRSRRWEVALEAVKDDPTSLGGLELSGWAFHKDASVVGIEISVQGQSPFVVNYGIERPDVAVAFPTCDVGRPGFRAFIHVIEDPVTLRITLRCADGRTSVVRRKLPRTHAMNDKARELYGAPNRFDASPLGLVRDLLHHGAIGMYIWQSRRIRGWARGNGEAEALAMASDTLGPSPVIVEVGTFLGSSAVLLAGPRKRRKSGHVHCVDVFSPTGDDAALPIYRAIADSLGMPMRQAFEENMRRAGLSEWITVHQMTSSEAARQWNSPIDLLYLDGDISIGGSRQTFQAWSPFLRRGGILAINGTLEPTSRTGSDRVVEEFVRPPDYEDLRRVDHVTFARKSKRS
jgi:hypothetical protein